MADSKISALTDGGNLQGSDQVAINRGGTSYRAVALQDGWIDDTAETWTYASGSGGGTATFTIAGVDLTAKYPVGTRIKLTQTTVKYFVVAAVSFSTNTTVTITAGTDYTLANAAISANFHSYAANPQGFPGAFNYTVTWGGFSANPAVTLARFAVVGRVCTIWVVLSSFGTSNATTTTFSVPIAAAKANTGGTAQSRDNGITQTAPACLDTAAGSTTVNAFKDFSQSAWTNSGGKGLQRIVLVYEV